MSMKKLAAFGLFFLISFFLISQGAFAAFGTIRSFGGKVTSTTLPGVTCAAQYGIVTITPVGGIFPPTPYVILATTKTIGPGKWILGLYNSILTPGPCYTDSPPPVPVPTFNIIKFGASKI